MEILFIATSILCTVLISIHLWKFLKWAWFEPKKKEKQLRELGYDGNSYTPLIGDYKEMKRREKEILKRPIPFSKDILERALSFFHDSIQKFGDKCFIWLGTMPTIVILDPKLIKEILSRYYAFQKIPSPINELIATGVVTYETDKWAKHRKLINPAFQPEKLKSMLPSFYLSCVDTLSKWEKIVPSEGSNELDVWPHLQTLTSDAISRTAFGSNYEEGRKIFELQNEQSTLIFKSIETFLIPGWRFLPTKLNRNMKKNLQQVKSSILEIIRKRMEGIEAGVSSPNDLLGILLESNFRETKENGNEFGMSIQEVVEECRLFYVAGQITTASLLVWTMILLGKHLDWQERARQEVLHVFTNDKLPDYQDLRQLKVITMIFHEVLRLYPPVTILSRIVNEETTLGNMTLPSGVQLLLPTISLHHDVNIWGDDAKEFNPERFSEGVAKATKGQFVYLPFGGGPRICIGQNFSMLEAKMVLGMILRRFSFEVSPSYMHAPESVVSLQPQYGAQLILRKI